MNIEAQVEAVLDKVRPYIQRDGGDIELVSVEDGVVYVRMLGACVGCFAIDDTITLGVESLLLDELEDLKGVVVVDD